jgi:hypothetical protein
MGLAKISLGRREKSGSEVILADWLASGRTE